MKPRVLSLLGLAAPSDPVAALDQDLARLALALRATAIRGSPRMAARLAEVIDRRLDQRHGFTADPAGPHCP